MPESIRIFLPELLLSGAALLLLGIDLSDSRHKKRWVLATSFISLLIALIMVAGYPTVGRAFGMIVADKFAFFFKILAIAGGMLIFFLSEGDSRLMGRHAGSYASLIIFSVVGTLFLSSAEDLLILFVGLELTTIPLFVLSGFLAPLWKFEGSARKAELRSSEGAIKFFLIGAFSTGLMIYGISLLYGVTGSTRFADISRWVASPDYAGKSVFFMLGILFLLVGLGFKFSLAPFHQWTPDAYEGAPTPITAFFSISRDAGVVVVLLRFFGSFVDPHLIGLTNFFFVLSVVTMTVGNITALRQTNLKRLLAYSSIAHAGTIFIGLVAGNPLGREGAMLYCVAYTLMSIGAFATVVAVSRAKESDDIDAIQGLAKENFTLALLMVFFLLSLSGIPPLLGFLGKFYVFAAAIQAKMYWLVAIGLINSLISVYYYFRIVHKMFFQETTTAPGSYTLNKNGIRIVTLFTAAAILILGIFPQWILSWIRETAQMLP